MPPITKKVRKKFQLFEKINLFFLLFLIPVLNSREVNNVDDVDLWEKGLNILEIEDAYQAQQINVNKEP